MLDLANESEEEKEKKHKYWSPPALNETLPGNI